MARDPRKTIALTVANTCVRNTVLEEYHARGSLSQEDIKTLMKEVVNKMYTWLYVFSLGTTKEQTSFLEMMAMFAPFRWDEPELDSGFLQAFSTEKEPGRTR